MSRERSERLTLFDPVAIGTLTAPNRIVMAPMARARADVLNRAGPLMAEYYAQRADAGLIIAEATAVSASGRNYYRCPGIYEAEQVEGWRSVVDAVRGRGGRIFLQLVHSGRATHFDTIGAAPVAPSAGATSTKTLTAAGFQLCSPPRALGTDEVAQIVEDFRHAAGNARLAGFDGIEIHAANGYLIDQFLKDSSNLRDDAYGGSYAHRTRLLLEIVEAVEREWPTSRIGVRLAPGRAQDCHDSDPEGLFSFVVSALAERPLAYVHMIEGVASGSTESEGVDPVRLRRLFSGLWITNNGYSSDRAQQALDSGAADLIAFGRPFIANPDLVHRLRDGCELAVADKETLFTHEAAGYTDYPAAEVGPLTGGPGLRVQA
jgi:N-ethylmaleimide reductase